MKKHNGRRKAQRRHQRVRHGAERSAPKTVSTAKSDAVGAGARSAPQRPQQPAKVPRREAWRVRGLAALGGVDWPAVAIVVVPLAAMAFFAQLSKERAPHQVRPSPVTELTVPQVLPQALPWRGDIALEAMPVVRDGAGRMAVASADPLLAPWHGDLALEAMPVMTDGAGRMAVANADPLPSPWHGDLSLDAMPIMPDGAGRTRVARVDPLPSPWHGDLALDAMPIMPDGAGRTAVAPVIGQADIAAAPTPICLPEHPSVLDTTQHSEPEVPPRHPVAFGRALAAAARTQLDDFVIYNPRYVTIAYPRGDTRPLYGVCTDVVVRAYRAFGIDFQELIHTSRLGGGDPSIDHRRVEVVRRFLERHGTSFEISEFPEDFLAGDIVTYHRPLGRMSQSHIAVVSDQMAPSGRPLIVHNRGWGPQIEDALFVDRITGHYRFSPADAEKFARTRQPRAAGRRQSSAVSVAVGQ